jgi:hypothetical protein
MNNNGFLIDFFDQKPKQKKVEVRLNANKAETDHSLAQNDYLGDCACSQANEKRGENEKIAPKIFISYAKEDQNTVEQLFEQLKKADFDPWLDSVKLSGGENWELQIEKAMSESDFVVICLSKNSILKFGQVQAEWKLALEINKKCPEDGVFLIPLRFDNYPYPESFKKIQYIDYFHEDGINKLINKINEEIKRRMKTSNVTDSKKNTKNDIRNFKIEFINRQHELDEIKNPGGAKLMAIDAPPGYGKSRLIGEVKNWYKHEKKDDWVCILINLKDRIDDYSKTPLLIFDSIAEQFMERVIQIRSHKEIIAHLINKNKNIILLFDAIECNPPAVKFLQDYFISPLMDALRRTHLICRAIFAGRYIQNPRRNWRGQHIEWDWSNYKIIKLTPLDSQIVRNSIINELKNVPLKDAEKEVLTIEIASLSCGHPGIIEKMLYNPPDGNWALEFHENQLSFEIKKELFHNCARPFIDDILNQIDDKNLREILNILTIFRRFHVNTIRALMKIAIKKMHAANIQEKMGKIIGSSTIQELLEPFSKIKVDALVVITNLVNTGLVSAPTSAMPFYHDAIIRKLILVQLQIDENSGRYLKLHALAHAIYDTWLADKNVDCVSLNPPLAEKLQADFIAESLYHLLNCLDKDQKSHNEKTIKDKIKSYRKILRSSFDPDKKILLENLKSILKQDEDIPDLMSERLGEDGKNRIFQLLG